jgi:hypothetical protein
MKQHHLPLLLTAAATDQSMLPKDNGGQLPRMVLELNGPDQYNNNDGHHRMGGGTTWTASGSGKTMHVGGTYWDYDQIGLLRNTTTKNNNNNDKGSKQP